MAFTVLSAARLPLPPPSQAGPLTTLQTSLHAADRSVAPPTRAFDTGLRPDPFPSRTASLLPGLLTATRTGLTPASDDEHEHQDHPATSRGHPLFRWAHESARLTWPGSEPGRAGRPLAVVMEVACASALVMCPCGSMYPGRQ